MTGMTLDARRQGQASRIDTGGQAVSSGFSAACGELAASPSPCPGADDRSYDEGFAGLARLIHVRLTESSFPASHLFLLLSPWTFLCRGLLPVVCASRYLPLGHASLRPGLGMMTSLLLRPCLPRSLPSSSALLPFS